MTTKLVTILFLTLILSWRASAMEDFNRWYFPGDLGKEKVAGPELQVGEPVFKGRFVMWGEEWARYNGAGGYYVAGGQGWYGLVTPDDYVEYPEMFSLIDGKRVVSSPGRGQLCLNSPEVLKRMADAAVQWFIQRYETPFSLSPNDNDEFCECPQCRAEIEEWGLSGYLLRFYNRVAEECERRRWHGKFGFLVYSIYTPPPKKPVAVHPSLIPQFTRLGAYGYPMSERTRDYLLRWRAMVGEDFATYEFFGLYDWPGFDPCVERMSAELRFYRDEGILLICGENHPHWATQGLQMWLWTQLLWNPDRDPWKLVDDYCRGMYHDGAGHMVEFYRLLETNGRPSAASDLRPLRGQWRRAYAQARSDGDAVATKRLDMVGVGLDFTEAWLNQEWKRCLAMVEEHESDSPDPFHSSFLERVLEAKIERG